VAEESKNEEYPWSCSLPNPMLMSGTPFIGREGIRESLVQYSFEPKDTAFIANARGYLDVSGGFGTYVSKPSNPDSLVIDLTIEEMQKQDFAFMRVHFQRPGIEGMKVGREKYADEPYYQNIWHETSRYQANEGWHEPFVAESNVTPLLVVGHGVTKPAVYDYCEIFDIAPTVTDLLGRKTPLLSHGRVLAEAFDADRDAPESSRACERLNRVLLAANAVDDAQKKRLEEAGFMELDDLGRWHTTPAGVDFEAFVSQQETIFEGVK